MNNPCNPWDLKSLRHLRHLREIKIRDNLCSVKNKDSFVLAGKTIWNIAVDVIEKEIEKADIKQEAENK